MIANRKRIAGFALKSRLPSVYLRREFVDAGGLMSYGADTADTYRRVATYVDRILKGAKPADLPVEQPTKFELVINLKTAKQIDVTIPPNVLARTDKIKRRKAIRKSHARGSCLRTRATNTFFEHEVLRWQRSMRQPGSLVHRFAESKIRSW
jgi:hypothetical protein